MLCSLEKAGIEKKIDLLKDQKQNNIYPCISSKRGIGEHLIEWAVFIVAECTHTPVTKHYILMW